MVFRVVFIGVLSLVSLSFSIPQYYCIGANDRYFAHLIKLIGCIHKTNFENLERIAIFDLGLSPSQKIRLRRMRKVKIYHVDKSYSGILDYYTTPQGDKKWLGWYAWKPVIIKQALQEFPYVLYIDAGSTIFQPLDHLFEYIKEHGYFICTIGDEIEPGKYAFPVGWGTTKYVIKKFGLEKDAWILQQPTVMGGIQGVTREASHYFIDPMCELAKNLKNYADDGTAPDGWKCARHDQTLLSVIAYKKNLTIFQQDFTQKEPMLLSIKNEKIPLYVTANDKYVCSKTHIYSSRWDLKDRISFERCIKYRKPNADH